MGNMTIQRTSQVQTVAPTQRQAQSPQPVQASRQPLARDGYDASQFKTGKAEPTTSLKNFSFANLGKGIGCVAAGGALVVGSAALISLTMKSTRAAGAALVKDVAARPGEFAKAFTPKGGNNTMLYIGLGVTALMVGIYACQKHEK